MSLHHFLLPVAVFLLTSATNAADRRKTELRPEEAEQLKRDKVLVTQRSYLQVFTPYIFSPMPVFLTSDSLLNAWHVLLEESFASVEERFSVALPAALDQALENLKEAPDGVKPEEYEKGLRHARIVLGIAAKLAGGKWSGGAEMDSLIAAEVQRVEAAAGVHLPAWLAPEPDFAGIDCEVFKPTGFYTRSERMKRYFRAVRWLQTIPFRVAREEEMAAMALLIPALEKSHTVPDIGRVHQSLGGGAADADLLTVMRGRDHSSNYDLRQWLMENAAGKSPKSRMVILSALALPDASVFQGTTSEKRPLPDGLEIAGFLGSPLALEILKPQNGPEVLNGIAAARAAWKVEHTIYSDYLRCLGLLLGPAEPDAPDFMKSQPWQRKSLNAALAGWAQLRHTWVLQSKDNAHWLPSGDPYPGFVEPNPEFFRRMSLLMTECMEQFEAYEALGISPAVLESDAAELVPLIEREAAGIHERMAPFKALAEKGHEFTEAEYEKISEAGRLPESGRRMLFQLAPFMAGFSVSLSEDEVSGVNDPEEAVRELREIAAGNRRARIMEENREEYPPSLCTRWRRLLAVCHQMETLAHKQLRGVEASDEEKSFIVGYGAKLGSVMFYDGNSYHHPRDDAPRIATVFSRPGDKCLLAGIGRPREIRVLYPWKGTEIECRGAIMPYNELISDRLTDDEWRQRLDDKEPPPLPEWLGSRSFPLRRLSGSFKAI